MENCAAELVKVIGKYRHLLYYNQENKAGFIERLGKEINELKGCQSKSELNIRVSGVAEGNIKLLTDLEACVSFSEFILEAYRDSSVLANQIGYLEDFFSKALSEPRGGILLPSEVERLLNLVQEKYKLVSALTYGKTLEIFVINLSHICFNSFLLTHRINRKGSYHDRLMLFSMSPCLDILECNRYFVFLHEIGHILYNTLAGSEKKEPDYFKEVITLMGFPEKARELEQDELFADMFSAAALHGSDFSAYNPYRRVLSGEILEFLEIYIRMLACQVERRNYQSPFDLSTIN